MAKAFATDLLDRKARFELTRQGQHQTHSPRRPAGRATAQQAVHRMIVVAIDFEAVRVFGWVLVAVLQTVNLVADPVGVVEYGLSLGGNHFKEIGSASCRERVCQYV